jgi:polar amino acid transport system substrate-binding protein
MLSRASIRSALVILAVLAGTIGGAAQQSVDPRMADVVRSGKIRIGTFPPQYVKDQRTGELRGWVIDLSRALGTRLKIDAIPVEHPGPDKVLENLTAGLCDVAFLPNNPAWMATLDFSDTFMQQDFTFLIPAGSAIGSVADADRPGVRIAVVGNHASTLTLVRLLKNATPVYHETLEGAFDLLRRGEVDLFASTRPQLIDDSERLPGSRVMEQRYGVNSWAAAVAKGKSERLAYMNEFIKEAKASGLAQQVGPARRPHRIAVAASGRSARFAPRSGRPDQGAHAGEGLRRKLCCEFTRR